MRELVSGVETIPALSNAMDRRIRLLNDSVDYMEKLHVRITKGDTNLLSRDAALEMYRVLSHEFTEVLEVCRRCSSDELVGRLENLHLYQLIQNLSPDEKGKLRDSLTPKTAPPVKTVDVKGTVSEPVYTPVIAEPPSSAGNPVPPTETTSL